MTAERCMCGATDCPICGPLQGYSVGAKPTARHYELALECVVETILDYGRWPRPQITGHQPRIEFDLYEWLLENGDSSFMLEMYVAALSASNFDDRIDRERKVIGARLTAHLKNSDFVAELAAEYAEDDLE